MHQFDLRETIVPFTLLQITNCFMRMNSGEVMEILGDDPGVYEDLKNILPGSEYEIFFKEPLEPNQKEFRLRLKKK